MNSHGNYRGMHPNSKKGHSVKKGHPWKSAFSIAEQIKQHKRLAKESQLSYEISQRDLEWNGPMNDPNAGSNGLYSPV